MTTQPLAKESAVIEAVAKGDYLFTWKDHPEWPLAKLRELVDEFTREKYAEEWWTCKAYLKVQPGDRAYLLKQGKPRIGIFGRGQVKKVEAEAPHRALIGFEVRRGDVLRDPGHRFENFLVSEEQLFNLRVPKTQWQNAAAGITLVFDAARQIDNITADSLRVGSSGTSFMDETVQEIARLKRLAEQWTRPEQNEFRKKMRIRFQETCAVTRCTTTAVLEAAHISTKAGCDDNSESNGILLRSDIHLLFDRHLITLSEDGTRLEVSPELTDQGYAFLRSVEVARPLKGSLSRENIREHRGLFFERQKLCSGKTDELLGPVS